MKPVLLAGETFPVVPDAASAGDAGRRPAAFTNGADRFIAALAARNIEVTQIGGERCETEFPRSLAALDDYAAVVLSDIGALPLLLTPEAKQGYPGVNRLDLLRQWVAGGGGLMMAGGYGSFQGMDGMARFSGTPVDECLPVECLPYSDGLEAPEGLHAELRQAGHPLLAGLPGEWPAVMGLNKVKPRLADDSQVIAVCTYRGTPYPLLAARRYGKGRTLAWTTDIGPHWLSRSFLDWPHYDTLMSNLVRWIARQS